MSVIEVASSETKRKRRPASAVTSGRKLFVEGDGNSPWSRRYRDLIGGYAADLGGAEMLSEAQKSLIRRVSAIDLACEEMEGRMSQGEDVDAELHASCRATAGASTRRWAWRGAPRISRA